MTDLPRPYGIVSLYAEKGGQGVTTLGFMLAREIARRAGAPTVLETDDVESIGCWIGKNWMAPVFPVSKNLRIRPVYDEYAGEERREARSLPLPVWLVRTIEHDRRDRMNLRALNERRYAVVRGPAMDSIELTGERLDRRDPSGIIVVREAPGRPLTPEAAASIFSPLPVVEVAWSPTLARISDAGKLEQTTPYSVSSDLEVLLPSMNAILASEGIEAEVVGDAVVGGPL